MKYVALILIIFTLLSGRGSAYGTRIRIQADKVTFADLRAILCFCPLQGQKIIKLLMQGRHQSFKFAFFIFPIVDILCVYTIFLHG